MNLNNKLKKETWELKSLGEIATEISIGRRNAKASSGIEDYPAIGRTEILQCKKNIYIDKCKNKVNIQSIKNPKFCKFGDLLLVQSCKRIENLGDPVVYLGNERPLICDHVFKISHDQNPKWTYHLMLCTFIKKQIRNFVEDTVIVDLREKHLRQIKIPLPPKHIQEKVANFLDQFSKLKEQIEEELNRELENRKKQYEYYKEAILINKTNGWQMISMDKVATKIISGKEISKVQLGTGDHPAIKCGDINSKFEHSFTECLGFLNIKLIKRPKFCEYGDILVGDWGSMNDVGKAVVYLGNEKPIIGNHIFLLKHQQNGRFLSYALSTKFARKQIKAQTRGGIVKAIVKSSFQHIKIPLPSLEEQNRIVEVLDKLRINIEALQNEIPLLIEDLRKQYLYFQKQMLDPEII